MEGVVLFAKAVALGLAVAAPLGPIGALCISRTLERGLMAGLAGGLGTALADAVWAGLAAAGFTALASLPALALPLKIGGGLFMLWLGVQTLRKVRHPAVMRAPVQVAARDLIGTTAATFGLTIANPATILSFAALFAGLGLPPGVWPASLTVAGVFAGSMLWWLILSGSVAALRHRLPAGFARAVSLISGLMLGGFGLWALGSAW